MPSVKTRLKSHLLSLLADRVPWGKLAYSQYGEDVALRSTLNFYGLATGFYLDIGAYHPVWMSNTFALYQAGWRGITVEPNAAFTHLFHQLRPQDTHLSCLVSPGESRDSIPFYSFGADAVYNTLSKESADRAAERLGPYTVLSRPSRTINEILSQHLPTGQKLDLLCLDCEGVDELLIQSLDWTRYRPAAVVFEFDGTFEQSIDLPTIKLLKSLGYYIFAKIGPSIIARLPKYNA